MAAIPKPPITRHIYGIPPKVDDVGVTAMVRNRRPGATVMHSIVGTLSGTDGYFDNPDTAALTDYGIGQTNHNGSGFAQIIQWCEIDGDLMPWASGPVRVPQGDGPRFLAHFGGSAAVNDVGVSIEHDDTTLPDGRVGPLAQAPVSVYQWSASIWLQAWLHAEIFKQTSATYDWNMHHREFCGSAYKECPHPRIINYTEQYQTAVKAIMDYYQKGTPYPAGGLVVAGLRINTPPESGVAPQGGQVKEPAPEKAEAYINAKGETIVVANLSGRATKIDGYLIVDMGVSVKGADGALYDRSIKGGSFKPWIKRG